MSNAKWRKLFHVVNENSVPLSKCVWKLVTEDKPKNGFLPDADHLGEDYVGDCGALNGPFSFKEIEWLELPAKVGSQAYDKAPVKYVYQDVLKIKELVDSVGKFQYEISDDGIRIYGYKP